MKIPPPLLFPDGQAVSSSAEVASGGVLDQRCTELMMRLMFGA